MNEFNINVFNVPLFEHVAEAATTAEEVENELVEYIKEFLKNIDLSNPDDVDALNTFAEGNVYAWLTDKDIEVKLDAKGAKVFHCTKDRETFDINIDALIERAKKEVEKAKEAEKAAKMQQYSDAFAQFAGQDVVEEALPPLLADLEKVTILFTKNSLKEIDISNPNEIKSIYAMLSSSTVDGLKKTGITVTIDSENPRILHCSAENGGKFDINIEDYLKKALDTPEDVKVGIIEQIQQQAAGQELSKPQVLEKFVKTITSETCKMLSSQGVKVTPDETDPYLLHCARGNEKFDVYISNLIEEALPQKDVIKAPKKTNHETAAEKPTIEIQWEGKETKNLQKMTLPQIKTFFASCINKWITDKKVNLSNDAEVEAFADEAFRLLYEKAKEIDEYAEIFDEKSRTLAIGKGQYIAAISVNDMILRNKLSNGIVKAVEEKIATYKKD